MTDCAPPVCWERGADPTASTIWVVVGNCRKFFLQGPGGLDGPSGLSLSLNSRSDMLLFRCVYKFILFLSLWFVLFCNCWCIICKLALFMQRGWNQLSLPHTVWESLQGFGKRRVQSQKSKILVFLLLPNMIIFFPLTLLKCTSLRTSWHQGD